ncbi:hypothetical protein L249_6715 [Ophiocordyceps polyrhachis-furcata BCC 54312]|uniref:Secreted protein n=1 Tax=Ophiocordyceps polyrhachis-furcata BCC 54312 TaxID=1330021 RepID=A0A367LLM2_9HYPO|nr:hypothetical protein L249_6715 [Ophiocordyceps polyrhachis-furcata BCC 54312]
MRCSMLLVALAAIQRGAIAMPADTNAAPPTNPEGSDSQASDGELTAQAAAEVSQGLQQSGLSQDKAQEVEQKLEQELKEKDTDSPKGVADIIGDISTNVVDVVPEADNTTQVPAVMSVVQGVINSTLTGASDTSMGGQDADALAAVAAALAVTGESKEKVAEAIESAMKSGSGAGNDSDTKSLAKRQFRNIHSFCSSARCNNIVDFSVQMIENRRSLQFMAACLSAMNNLFNFGAAPDVFGVYRDQINGFSGGNDFNQLQRLLLDTTRDLGQQNKLSPTIVNSMNNILPLCFDNSQFLGNFGRHGGGFGQRGGFGRSNGGFYKN